CVRLLPLREEGSWEVISVGGQTRSEVGTDTAWTEPTLHLTILIDPLTLIQEDFLHRDDVSFHTDNLRDRHHFTCTVGKTACLDDDIDGARYLLTHRLLGDVQVRHRNHRFEAAERVAGR